MVEAREELKRLEHIIYVSLKYTRTIDVIRNALSRLVSIYDLIIQGILEKEKYDGNLTIIANNPALRAKKLAELCNDDSIIQKHLCFYQFLKNVLKLPFDKREEFRRHVTLVVELEESTAEINIDNLTNCERFAHGFLNYGLKKLGLEKPVDD